ncbi:MAG: GDP-mannose 4,6-dehydratase [Acidobacteriota bacterium]|nr:GDP-mannose 4,6-dehydratase [Acidobacteriota bacterium]
MRAFITGIAGFAGNYLADLLLRNGLDVHGLSEEAEFRPFLPIDSRVIHYASIDIQNQRRVGEFLSAVRPDLVFHLAAKSSPSRSLNHPGETFAVNFGGTLAVLEAIRLHKIPCRFLLVSSSHVYGGGWITQESQPVTEEAPLRPESPYAASKAASEMAAFQYWKSYGIETVIVRAFNHSGPGQGPGFVCPDLARKVVEIERGLRAPRLEVSGLRRQIDFSDVRDVVLGYYRALVTGSPGSIYNICSGKLVTIKAITEVFLEGSPRSISVVPSSSESEAKGRPGILGDNSRAQRELGWEPSVPFERTVKEVIQYTRQTYPVDSSVDEVLRAPKS